jgi:hypothetical protein
MLKEYIKFFFSFLKSVQYPFCERISAYWTPQYSIVSHVPLSFNGAKPEEEEGKSRDTSLLICGTY